MFAKEVVVWLDKWALYPRLDGLTTLHLHVRGEDIIDNSHLEEFSRAPGTYGFQLPHSYLPGHLATEVQLVLHAYPEDFYEDDDDNWKEYMNTIETLQAVMQDAVQDAVSYAEEDERTADPGQLYPESKVRWELVNDTVGQEKVQRSTSPELSCSNTAAETNPPIGKA